MESIQPFEKALLVLYRDGSEVATITFEQDEYGVGSPIVQLEDRPIDERWLSDRSLWGPTFDQPVFRVEAGRATIRLLQDGE